MIEAVNNQDLSFDLDDVIRQTGLDMEEYMEIFEIFKESFVELMGDLEQALSYGNIDGVMSAAHTIKGATSNIGFLHIAELARQIQDEPGDSDLVKKNMPMMRDLYAKVVQELESMAG